MLRELLLQLTDKKASAAYAGNGAWISKVNLGLVEIICTSAYGIRGGRYTHGITYLNNWNNWTINRSFSWKGRIFTSLHAFEIF